MTRVIHTENLAAERNRLMKGMALALRELTKLAAFNTQARDLAAFLVLALDGVAETIEHSVQPWEKRGYWLKGGSISHGLGMGGAVEEAITDGSRGRGPGRGCAMHGIFRREAERRESIGAASFGYSVARGLGPVAHENQQIMRIAIILQS